MKWLLNLAAILFILLISFSFCFLVPFLYIEEQKGKTMFCLSVSKTCEMFTENK